nr:protein transport protein sec31-like [Drosophila kikkawai]
MFHRGHLLTGAPVQRPEPPSGQQSPARLPRGVTNHTPADNAHLTTGVSTEPRPRLLQTAVPHKTSTSQRMDGQGQQSQDYSWMCVAVEEILQALQGAGPSSPRPHNSSVANNAGLFPRAPTADVTSANGEATTADNHAEPQRPPTEEMPLLHPAYRPHRAAGAPPEVAPLDGNDEEEVPRDHRFGPLRVNLTPPRPRDTSPGDRAPSADAEEAWNQAIALSDDWVDFDGLVEDTLGDLFNSPPHTEPPATGALGPLGAVYDLVSDDEGRPRAGTYGGGAPHRRTRADNRAPPYMGEVEAALMECFGEMPGDDFNWGSGTNTASTISADEDEEGRPSDASRPPSAGPAEDASSSTVSADEGEASQDSDWSYAPRSPPPRWTPPSTTPLQSWAPAAPTVAASHDPRPRLPTGAELAAEEARRRAEDLSEELGNPPVTQPPASGPPPSPTPRRRARRRSAPWADSPSSSSDESSLDADEGVPHPPRWVPAPVEWTTPNGTLPAALLRRIHGRLATPRRRTIRILEEEGNQRFRVQINRSGRVIITLHPSRR